MTDRAATGPTTTGPSSAGARPPLLTLAAILLGVSAILALLFPISQATSREFLGCSIAIASVNASPSGSPSATVTPPGSSSATVIPKATTAEQQRTQFDGCRNGSGAVAPASDDDISSLTPRLLLQGLIPLIVLGALGFFAYRGVPLVRWFTVGVWILGGLIGIVPLGPLQAVGVTQSSYPVVTVVLVVLGSITFTAAAVLVNLPQVTRYFSARRPVRAAARGGGAAGGGGLLGGLFGGARPPRGAAGGTRTTPPVSMDKPATDPTAPRPPKSKGSGGSGNTGRSKGKKRG